jgi:hypothetical protein
MGQTVGGLPWPEDTDAVMAGAQAIRALAEALDRLVYNAERVAQFSVGGGGTDVQIGGGGGTAAWETIDSNFAPTAVGPGPPIGAPGFTTPRAGLWQVTGNTVIIGTLTSTIVTCSIFASGGKEIAGQNFESGGGNIARSVACAGMFRLAAGETVVMRVSQNSGAALNFGGGTAPGTRRTTRFSGQWIGP